MRRWILTAAILLLFLGPAADARADALGPGGYAFLGAMMLSLITGGLLLSLAFIWAGFLLVRGRERIPPGSWGGVGWLILAAVVVGVGGPALMGFLFAMGMQPYQALVTGLGGLALLVAAIFVVRWGLRGLSPLGEPVPPQGPPSAG
jgi:hypothetical protein